jgi:signal peptidase I
MGDNALVRQSRTAPAIVRGSRSLLSELAQVLVLALLLYFAITFAVQTVHVLGSSMYPSLHTEDYLIATKVDYRLHAPQRGDIVILKDPYNDQTDFIKRVIALPGEELIIHHGEVRINGHLLAEPYLAEPWVVNNEWPRPASGIPSSSAGVIPAGRYFVMGDNRNHSSDSRSFGPIARDQIDSRAWVRIWPLRHAGLVDRGKAYLEGSAARPAA